MNKIEENNIHLIKEAEHKNNFSLKNKEDKKSLKIIQYKNIIKLIILINFIHIFSINKKLLDKMQLYNITLKIKGKGKNYVLGILSNDYDNVNSFPHSNYPKEIYINDINQSEVNYFYNFEQENNTVTLIWYNKIDNCRNMFRYCSNITEIDFSDLVESMWCMFCYCTSLISLNLSNFKTSSVTALESMFSFCYSLSSIELSSFNTSQVSYMNSMFKLCRSLTSLNLSNFDTSKVVNMGNMFKHCSSLTVLDLSNFNTSNVRTMSNLFSGCIKLELLILLILTILIYRKALMIIFLRVYQILLLFVQTKTKRKIKYQLKLEIKHAIQQIAQLIGNQRKKN